MSETIEQRNETIEQRIARNAWIEARRRVEEAQDAANQRCAEYLDITQPEFAQYFRRVLGRKRQ